MLFSQYSVMVRVFDPIVNGQALIFEYYPTNNTFTDNQTESQWDFEGKSIDGPLKETALKRLPLDEGFWFEWVAFHPQTELYQVS